MQEALGLVTQIRLRQALPARQGKLLRYPFIQQRLRLACKSYKEVRALIGIFCM
ncbi:hypothetical protein CS8_026980 [Cupriavidus sp. 8B]